MSKATKKTPQDKALARLLKNSASYKWSDLKSLFELLGYNKTEQAGLRVAFHHPENDWLITFHKPHPKKEADRGMQSKAIKHLKENGVIK